MDTGLTDRVVSSFDGAASPRYAEIMRSLVRHLHAFLADVRLTEQEWATAVDFLTRTGQKCDAKRQEFILLSDVLGASMAVIGLNHPTGGTATESTVLGPFFVEGAPEFRNGDDISGGAPGEPCYLHGTIRGPAGEPVGGALIDVWQSDETGNYDVQYPDLDRPRGRGRLRADENGRYRFWSVHPEAYPIPHDGPVGELLTAAGRGPMRPAHVHFKVAAPGYRTLITHIFAAGDKYLDSDAVFGVRESLIVDFEHHEPGPAPDGSHRDTPFSTATFDIALSTVDVE
ncbi:MAG TPA: intradiol ring-cleavage dioxygenase [Actinophytocola sp.]|uniref:intradiol ring-cleavage dioxygenase n=1 Tax=Actinophytocola sp. TaxID=1872138 RepID=UPI002DDCBD60|nr:intradiol ring-cleavage dioxygenase [Actinophytocola sp.]HEV2784215.1 intradiol ring-cleavage dioxygenase [Actinophytocola sp.]